MLPELPTIIQVRFADLQLPLLQSAEASPPPPAAAAPAFLSQFLSENSRWASIKTAAAAIMANPDCPRTTQPVPSSERALPVVLRVRGPAALRVRLQPSLSSEHVATLRPQVAFAFSQVSGGWAKLSPMHYTDLQTARDRCHISDFKNHDIEAHGHCITVIGGKEIFEEPSDEEKAAVLARFVEFHSGSTATAAAASRAPAHAAQWEWPCDRPPCNDYCDGDGCVNITAYVSLALPLFQRSDCQTQWARFLRCALFFAHATSAPQQRSKRALLLQVSPFILHINARITRARFFAGNRPH
jgi:hypothetical protein